MQFSAATDPLCDSDSKYAVGATYKMNVGWIDRSLLRDFQAEGTDAYRLCTFEDGWIERFGRDVLVSFKRVLARERLIAELHSWSTSVGIEICRVFARSLPRKSEQREPPRLIYGDASEDFRTVATERHLRFGIDFATGYSPGLFLDQRENRHYLRQLRSGRLLNCFAYTCSFSVCAATGGAATLNVDLSKKYLARGRENFALNSLPTIDHRFVADDVRAVLPDWCEKAKNLTLSFWIRQLFRVCPAEKAFKWNTTSKRCSLTRFRWRSETATYYCRPTAQRYASTPWKSWPATVLRKRAAPRHFIGRRRYPIFRPVRAQVSYG